MDEEETNTRNHAQHGQRQTVEAQREVRCEAADLQPLPQLLGEHAVRRRVSSELDRYTQRRQRRDADRADAIVAAAFSDKRLPKNVRTAKPNSGARQTRKSNVNMAYPFNPAAASVSSVRKRR